jgi:flagellin
MAFSIQTNVNSLIAQENLRVSSDFQGQTIQRLTSGYRINSSADDAAGLAIANKFRSDQAELTQGVRNANDGISTLQIINGGMSNVSKMLDRLRTLATQSASGTFTGDREVLNTEYQTLVNEIDRQSQAIGLSTGGQFAKSLSVYIGGGKTVAGALDTNNGAVTLDLTNSVVDSKALGLRTSDYQAASASGTNLAAGSSTSVANIFAANGGTATFELSGAGFSSAPISITLTTSDTTSTVVDKLNTAIQGANNSGTDDGNALRTADITANLVKDSAGKESITFTSANSAFQVVATTTSANALMGNFDSTSTNAATGVSASQKVTSEVVGAGAAVGYVKLQVTVDGVEKDLNVKLAATDNTATLFRDAIRASSTYSDLTALGISAEVDTTTNKVYFTGDSNQSIRVASQGDTTDTLGFGAWQQGSEVIGAAAPSGTYDLAAGVITVTVNGGANITLAVDETATGPGGVDTSLANIISDIKASANYNTLKAAGVDVYDVGGRIAFIGNAGQAITVSTGASDTNNRLGLNTTTTNNNFIQTGTAATLSAGASGNTATVSFSINGGDKISVTFASDGTLAGAEDAFQAAVDNNTELKAAGITIGTNLASVSAATGVNFRMMVEKQTGTLQLGVGTAATSSLATFSATTEASMVASGGASQTGLGSNHDVYSYRGLTNTAAGQEDSQVVSFTTTDSAGTQHSLAVTLTTSNGGDVDSAVAALNDALQGANSDSTLKQIVAVKETNAAGTAEGIRFISSLGKFSVLAGVSNNTSATVPVGMYNGTAGATAQGLAVDSSSSGTIDISNQAGAAQAIVALGTAVTRLGSAQAAIGKGQNQLNYAVGLAQSQISNFASAESRIRDADIAAEAANLTKAQVLQQASMAAMAQANSAPQAVLALLRG